MNPKSNRIRVSGANTEKKEAELADLQAMGNYVGKGVKEALYGDDIHFVN